MSNALLESIVTEPGWKEMIRRAETRIYISSLYIGSAETELVCSLIYHHPLTDPWTRYLLSIKSYPRNHYCSFIWHLIWTAQQGQVLLQRPRFSSLFYAIFRIGYMCLCSGVRAYVGLLLNWCHQDLTKDGGLGMWRHMVSITRWWLVGEYL